MYFKELHRGDERKRVNRQRIRTMSSIIVMVTAVAGRIADRQVVVGRIGGFLKFIPWYSPRA